MRHAVIDSQTHIVQNVIVWDGKQPWQPPKGTYLIRHDKCDIGDTYDARTNSFSKP